MKMVVFSKNCWIKVLVGAFIVLGSVCFTSSYVQAGGAQGDGGYGDGTNDCDGHNVCECQKNWAKSMICDNTKRNFENIKGKKNMTGMGGHSWHIFATSEHTTGGWNNEKECVEWGTKKNGKKYCKKYKHYNNIYDSEVLPAPTTHNSIKEYDKQLADNCPKSDYSFYLANVYDGWDAKTDLGPLQTNLANGVGEDKAIVYWGPVENGAKPRKHYHLGGAVSFKDANKVTDAVLNGTYTGNVDIRITQSAANKFYKEYYKATHPGATDIPSSIPEKTGYFCYVPPVANTQYEGAISVSGGGVSQMIGFTQQSSNDPPNYVDMDCTNGCEVTFGHYLKQVSGTEDADDETSYGITKTDYRKYSSSSSVPLVNFGSNPVSFLKWYHKDQSTTIWPGDEICETLTFDPSNNTENVSLTLCAIARGGSNSSSLSIDVSNAGAKDKSFRDTVYAKPQDWLTYRSTYNAGAQAYASSITPKIRINSGNICSSWWWERSGFNAAYMLSACGGGTWKNGYRVYSKRFGNKETGSPNYYSNYVYNVGNVNIGSEKNRHQVAAMEVGLSLDETALTNTNDGVSTVPRATSWGVDCLGGRRCYPTLLVDTTQMKDDAHARVPYNFEIEANIKNNDDENNNDDEDVIYAGEETYIPIELNLRPKSNCETTENCKDPKNDYATIARDVESKLIVYDPAAGGIVGEKDGGTFGGGKGANLCGYFNINNGNQDDCSSGVTKDYGIIDGVDFKTGKTFENGTATFYAKDAPAGSKICVAIAVFPASSGADTNWNDTNYDNTWRISKSKCYTIAKKPSLQVWGGNVYSGGNINTAVANKRSLDRITRYSANAAQGTYVFGSWGELGVINSGATAGFASGASLGYASNNNGSLIPSYQFTGDGGITASYHGFGNKGSTYQAGGGTNSSMCNNSPLTFANSPCEFNIIESGIGNSISTNNAKTDKTALIDTYIYGGSGNNSSESGNVSLNSGGNVIDGVRYYYNKDEDGTGFTINEPQIVDPDTIQIVHSTGNIMINGDIKYADTSTYNNFNDLSKLVIYAEKDIYIGCNVERIDAVLIAGKGSNDGNVITCADSKGKQPEVNSQERSRQLRINGAVIANKLTPNRTYGAATGANSIIPAEIINFDPTLYLWGGGDSVNSEGRNTNMDITYTRELAPRL